MKKLDIIIVGVIIILLGYLVLGYIQDTTADDSMDFSWTSRSAEIVKEKELQNEMFRQNKEELNKIINENKIEISKERCKLEKLDPKATCEGLEK